MLDRHRACQPGQGAHEVLCLAGDFTDASAGIGDARRRAAWPHRMALEDAPKDYEPGRARGEKVGHACSKADRQEFILPDSAACGLGARECRLCFGDEWSEYRVGTTKRS